jgi:transglutaminase superfamily protein
MSLDFYRQPAALSDAGAQARLFKDLPSDPAGLAKVVQGLLMHEHVAPAYGLKLSGEQHAQAHVRPVEKILQAITQRDARPLSVARAEGQRQIGVCRHFTLMHVAMLRSHGVPARARCGFGAYFEKGKFVDHWVTEYWNERAQRWILVDAQLDAHQRELFKVLFDPLDVPRDQFLVAGDAWRLCRTSKADPKAFGILDMHGLWFIAGNVVRDLAALNNREMLPWDVWGPMVQNDDEIDVGLIDRLAALTSDPDAHFAELRAVYDAGPPLSVPPTVFNAVLNRAEAA